MDSNNYFTQIRSQIERDEIPGAAARLKELLHNSPQLNQVLQQSARHRAMAKQIAAGVITVAQANRTKDDIRKELLELIGEIERQQQQKPQISDEVTEAISMILAKERRKEILKVVNRLGLGLLVLVILAGIWLYALRDRIWPQSFVLTVLVHGEKGPDDRILQNQGQVMLDIGTARFREDINADGEATFKEIPGLYLDRSALVSVEHPQPYKAVHPDSQYVLRNGQAIYLEVELTGLDSVFGLVRDFITEKPLDSVRVSMRGLDTYTDEYGWFVLHIPANAREKSIDLHFFKEGYQDSPLYGVFPHTQQERTISLNPENK